MLDECRIIVCVKFHCLKKMSLVFGFKAFAISFSRKENSACLKMKCH